MKLRNKIILSAAVFFAAGMLAGHAVRSTFSEPTFSASQAPVILLDAGHGSPDGGAVGVSGTIEKDINLAITLKTGEVLENRGCRVVYTRTSDSGIHSEGSSLREMKLSDMRNRRKLMESSGADIFISIHMNSFENASASGLHVFYSAAHEEIRPLAEAIQGKIASATGARAHAVKTVSESLFLTKDPPLPCILAECGFLSNPEEERQLNDDNYQSRIAWAIADSTADYFDRMGIGTDAAQR